MAQDGKAPSGEIVPLTSIRGIAAVGVMMYHLHDGGVHMAQGPLRNLIARGYMCVDLFFVLSGFVMGLVYSEWFRQGWTRERHGAFLWHRLARMYPAYFVVLMVLVAQAALTGSEIENYGLLRNTQLVVLASVLLVQSWGLASSIIDPAWSISTEWTVYLFFPALLPSFVFRGFGRALSAFAAAVALLVFVALSEKIGLHPHRDGPFDVWQAGSPLPFLRCLGSFGVGLFLYRLFSSEKARGWYGDGVTLVTTVAFVALVVTQQNDLWVYPCFPMIILNLAGNQGLGKRLLSAWPLHRLGELSYSLFLTHESLTPVMEKLKQYFSARLSHGLAVGLAVGLTYVIMFAVATCCFRWVERPLRRKLRSFSETRFAFG